MINFEQVLFISQQIAIFSFWKQNKKIFYAELIESNYSAETLMLSNIYYDFIYTQCCL